MQSPDDGHRLSGTELVEKSGAVKKATRFTLPDDPNTAGDDDSREVTLDVSDDSVVVNAKVLQKKSSSITRITSSRFKKVAKEVKLLATVTRRHQTVDKFDPAKSAAAQALRGLKFISETDADAWKRVDKRFDDLTTNTNRLLPRSLFAECIGMNKKEDKEDDKLFASELFDALCRRRNIPVGRSITKDELKDLWDQITDQSFDGRLQIFFDMVDKNGDGRISEDEIKDIIASSASANHLPNIQKQADECARLIMEELDPDNLGFIPIENLKMLLLEAPEQSIRGETRELSKMISQKQIRPPQDHPLIRWYKNLHHFLQDYWKRVWVMALWMGAMGGLFAYKYVEYKNKEAFQVMGHCVCMAKGAAETLKLNMALILFPMCRNTITWLRNRTRLGAVIPFDDNVNFHQVIAVAIGIGVGIHGISHLACDFPRLLNADPEKYEPMEKYFGEQPTSYWFFVKGWEGVTGIIMVVLMAIAFTLASPWFRSPKPKKPIKPKDGTPPIVSKLKENGGLMNKLTGFNAFWYTHHLFIIVYTLLIIHGIKLYLTKDWHKKTTWMYVTIPMVIYAGERLARTFKSSIEPVKILKVAVHRDVVELHMSKPDEGFKYKSGQYLFVNCSTVSPFEWHPFSITSAPRDDYLSVHIRARGDWTKQMKVVFKQVCKPPPEGGSGPHRADFLELQNNSRTPRVKIDGPYGAPTQDYKNYDVVLLIGLGIGATPMISVLKDIANNMKEMEDIEKGKGGKRKTSPKHEFKTKRAYFYWMTREQDSFDWFKDVMNEVAEMDHQRAIEMHNYCTSVYEEGDARSALIAMLQTINHAKRGVDIVSGIRVKSHFARPNWRAVYNNIAHDHPHSTVGVFYCGAPAPIKDLKRLSSELSDNTNTKFEFHKENF